jgi:hypothetical protein
MKKKIRVIVESGLAYTLDCSSIQGAIETLQKYFDWNKDKFSNLRLEIQNNYDDSSFSMPSLCITGEREETDDEYNKRIQEEALYAERTKERELRTLAELAEKFGKKLS